MFAYIKDFQYLCITLEKHPNGQKYKVQCYSLVKNILID